jgi:hypothetical protein
MSTRVWRGCLKASSGLVEVQRVMRSYAWRDYADGMTKLSVSRWCTRIWRVQKDPAREPIGWKSKRYDFEGLSDYPDTDTPIVSFERCSLYLISGVTVCHYQQKWGYWCSRFAFSLFWQSHNRVIIPQDILVRQGITIKLSWMYISTNFAQHVPIQQLESDVEFFVYLDHEYSKRDGNSWL